MEETVDEMSVTSTREHVDEIEVDDIERVCVCWGFTAQSTQWGHVERGQFT